MAKETWAISKLDAVPPVRVPYYPVDENREYIMNFCQCANEAHAKAGTGWVFRVFQLNQ
jgi:hypothetical protein